MSAVTRPENPEVQDLIDRAMRLSPAERQSVVLELLESLDTPPKDSSEVRQAWKDEIAQRIREIEEGKVQLVDAREAVARLRQELREQYGI